MKRYIAYLRVSTDKQGEHGHGIHAQRQAIGNYLGVQGGELLEEYVEIESGKKDDRPALQQAISRCKMSRATLIIAKLDRLSRNLAFIANLMDAGIDFIACDNPYATRLTIHILAAIAEHEREMISRRTKEALAAAKAKGVVLGGARGAVITDRMRQASVAARQQKGMVYLTSVLPTISQLRATGHSLGATARQLNNMHIYTVRGGQWTATSVRRALKKRRLSEICESTRV
ncbi:MAG: recombinase family protein [Desulfobacter sp.]